MSSTKGPGFYSVDNGKEEKANDAVQSQTIDRSDVGLPDIASSGYHMPPEVLGVRTADSQGQQQEPTQQNRRQGNLADVNSRSRKRSIMAIRGTKSQAAIAAAAKTVSERGKASAAELDYSIFTLLTFEGAEVIFANTSSQTLVGVCSRTHFIFQTLTLPSKAPIVSISSNSQSGMLIVAHEDGIIQTYKPVPTKPCEFGESTRDEIPRSAFGKFRWVDCLTINASNVFYQPGESINFGDRRIREPGKLLDISSSCDHRILVAHRKQLAVFEATPLGMTSEIREKSHSGDGDATLLWTTILPSNIVTAKISGDGQGLVVVLDTLDDKEGYGAMTFVHDTEDGSLPLNKPNLERSASIGMVYKAGPFLKHSAEVTRISFRGLGRETSSISADDGQGNDLLLTYCDDDSSVRIFNQNSWQQLMLWSAPPNSRADWIRGSAAFSLGDLESQKKPKSSSRQLSRRPSENSDSMGNGPGVGAQNSRALGTGSPTTSAGAWIAEITFRDAFPALRLSRLSYMKRGNADSQPAHFESVAAILPAGSIVADSVLKADDMGLAIQGVWPAWNPWLSETTGPESSSDDILSGSAMEFLGLLSAPPPTSAFGDSFLGGSHSPPTELRIAASHPTTGNLVLMEFPLWGDEDFGAMELGSPVRSVLSLSDAITSIPDKTKYENEEEIPSASMEHESSRLCAKLEPITNCISLLLRKPGSMSLYSPDWRADEGITTIMEASETPTTELLHDMSIIPAPLALPALSLPKCKDHDKIVALRWLPDNSFGGPPLLLSLTKSGTFLVFEIPPPWSATEPAMPNYDPFNAPSSDSLSINGINDSGFPALAGEATDSRRQEYVAKVTPHPDFGLGLRLESPMDGLPAIAGSFKKNPLNGGMLPAEKTGMIVLGDELLSVNGVGLENMTFDDIIATVRHVGAESGPGEALSLEFRPATAGRSGRNSFSSLRADSSIKSESPGRPKERKGMHSHQRTDSDEVSIAGVLLGTTEKTQQEFGRLIAVVRKGLPLVEEQSLSQCLIIRPWEDVVGSTLPNRLRRAALIVLGAGNKIYVKRLELPLDVGPDDARIVDLGCLDMTDEKEKSRSFEIRDIKYIESARDSMAFVLSDSQGCVKIMFLTFSDDNGTTEASFRHFSAFGLDGDSLDFRIRAPSVNLFATMQRRTDSPCQTITLWSARPDPSCRRLISDIAVKDEYFDQDYVPTELKVESADWNSSITDFCFLSTGHLDTFPALVVFMSSEAIVYQRRGGSLKWLPMVRLTYPSVPDSSLASRRTPNKEILATGNPLETFPHILPSLRAALSSYDELKSYVSDWHPEALIAHLCTDERGAKAALSSRVRGILLWLSNWIASSDERMLSTNPRLGVAPLDAGGIEFDLNEVDSGSGPERKENTSEMLMNSFARKDTENPEKIKLQQLLEALENVRIEEAEVDTVGRSREFKLAMSSGLQKNEQGSTDNETTSSTILSSLQPNELRALWAIAETTMNPPQFRKLDIRAQLALTIISIHRAMKRSPVDDTKVSSMRSPSQRKMKHVPSFYVKRKSFNFTDEKSGAPVQVASAGCVAALLSDFQGQLVESLRQPGIKFDWYAVKEMRLPFWLRSDDALREVSEEIGQKLYRESRDILKSALYFILAGKKRTLRNLAAADNTDSGIKLFKFLTDFDFSSERGRSAAEKNAFSLLRKNRYDCAAAFFLLAEPPIIKAAVETIASKMEDLDLAFMVARLMGKVNKPQGGTGYGVNMTGYAGNVIGGGGGYAGSSGTGFSDFEKDKVGFCDWKPDLCQSAIDLLNNHGLPESWKDTCFSALQLIWLGRQDEASHWLSGFLGTPDGLFPSFSVDNSPPCLHQLTKDAKKSKDPTVYTISSFMNFASGPLLLKMMKSSKRTRIASALLVSNSLSRLGFELPCLQLVLQNINLEKFEEEDSKGTSETEDKAKHTSQPQSSIFDDFMTNPNPPATKTIAPAQQMSSSIFDSFDVPQPTTNKNSAPVSSIFDDFDVAPQARSSHAIKTPDNGQMASSIFDSFDTAPPSRAPARSSIFDSFDGNPNGGQKNTTPSGGEMNSSIFDSFSPPPPTKSNASAPASKTAVEKAPDSEKKLEPIRSPPLVWLEWTKQHLLDTAAKRLIRELISIGSRFHGEAFEPFLTPDGKRNSPLVPSIASQVLQFHCNGQEIIQEVAYCVEKICKVWNLKSKNVVSRALQMLWSPCQYHRLCFVVLLHLSQKQLDLAEDVVRSTAQSLMESCTSNAFSNDDLAHSRQSVSHVKTLYLRRLAANLSWQLELCLWLHRGGALPLSGAVLNEAICAVRIGLLVASWNQDFTCLETMIKYPPDCLADSESGRQLWTSLKIISSSSLGERKLSGTGNSSGGWEFLVECRRSEATEMLRPRPPGCFLIRPHPEDHGVFTLSFKTNLTPAAEGSEEESKEKKSSSRPVKRDDVVQHAIIRLSDSGFRCGSFGPFGTLMSLLEAVSSSLPFKLRFDQPPNEGLITEEGTKPSPNSAFFRRLGLSQAENKSSLPFLDEPEAARHIGEKDSGEVDEQERKRKFGLFLETLLLASLRKQLSGVAAARYDKIWSLDNDDTASVGNLSEASDVIGAEQEFSISARMLRPLLLWCRVMEIGVVSELAPKAREISHLTANTPLVVDTSRERGVEISTAKTSVMQGGDAAIRKMIQTDSGVEFRTLRLGEGGESAMVVLFDKKAAIAWFIDNGHAKTEDEALKTLITMEKSRVIEAVDLDEILTESRHHKVYPLGGEEGKATTGSDIEEGTQYRLVDPWEVEPLYSREAETRGACLGRNQYLAFSLGRVTDSCESMFRSIGGVNLLDLWSSVRGGISLTKAMASIHPPWERAAGGDLELQDGLVSEPVPYMNSIRQHMYRNSLFRRLDLPQRFVALIQVELLDLKNLTSPGGSLSLTVYSLLRLKRSRSNAPLNTKSRTLDSVATSPMRLGKPSGATVGPNPPASWGSLVRFRFPLPEDTTTDCKSFDTNRESLFKGPPSVLQVSVYEKKFMSDSSLGSADVKLDGLSAGGQLEEWVPLRVGSNGINWFARIRLTLRFELMCLSPEKNNIDGLDKLAPSVSLRRIQQLYNIGGAQEDNMKKSSSTSELLSYFESMVS